MSEPIGELKVSQGNSKIGKVPNLSLPPIISCRGDAPCKIDCYAQKFYRVYPNVRAAWNSNLDLLRDNPDKFYSDLALYLAMNRPERFRLHVAGDFEDEEHFCNVVEVFRAYPGTRVLAFTKRYDLDLPLDDLPANFKLVLSVWPGLDLPTRADFPWAWVEGDVRFPIGQTHISCQGNCIDCEYACWDGLSADLHVRFKKH